MLVTTNFSFYICADKREYGTIGSWLSTIGLGQYENVLIINGFDNIKMLVSSLSYYGNGPISSIFYLKPGPHMEDSSCICKLPRLFETQWAWQLTGW